MITLLAIIGALSLLSAAVIGALALRARHNAVSETESLKDHVHAKAIAAGIDDATAYIGSVDKAMTISGDLIGALLKADRADAKAHAKQLTEVVNSL